MHGLDRRHPLTGGVTLATSGPSPSPGLIRFGESDVRRRDVGSRFALRSFILNSSSAFAKAADIREVRLLDWLDGFTADCPRKRAAKISDQCHARCPDLP
jgi:hypothetical protein